DKEELYRLRREGNHFVYVGRRDVPGTSISYTAADYVTATRQLTELMFNAGHRQVIYICLDRIIESNQDREQGFFSAYQQRGFTLPDEPVLRIDPEQISVETVQTLLKRGITAAAVENDSLALALWAALKNLGLSVPADFSITLCGNPQRAIDNSPQWTMFTIPRREMGQHAVRLLVRQMQNSGHYEPESIDLPCTIVPGQTIAPPPASTKK
ncbi:MAG: LacI family DNA-binding transcriptional regulator, partial [Chloroflexota bacterium]